MFPDLKHFYPDTIEILNDRVFLIYKKLPEAAFDTPFLHQGIKRYQTNHNKKNTLLISLDELLKTYDEKEHIKPTGFIFHLTRCGSTLITQVLAQMPNTRNLNEPMILGQVISKWLKGMLSKEQTLSLIKIIVDSFITSSDQQPSFYFIKLATWQKHIFQFVSQLYPNTPIIFLVRDPLEILASQNKALSNGIQNRFLDIELTSRRMNLSVAEIQRISVEEFFAIKMRNLIQTVIDHFSKNILVIDHKDFPNIIFEQILPHFNLFPSSLILEKMKERTLFNSKKANQKFQPKDKEHIILKTTQVSFIKKYVSKDLIRLKELNQSFQTNKR